MNAGDLVKVKKSTTWRNTTLPSTAIIIEVLIGENQRYRIHTGELFFARDLEVINESR